VYPISYIVHPISYIVHRTSIHNVSPFSNRFSARERPLFIRLYFFWRCCQKTMVIHLFSLWTHPFSSVLPNSCNSNSYRSSLIGEETSFSLKAISPTKDAPSLINALFLFQQWRHCARVVNGIALKATGLRPRRFESCQCRTIFVFLHRVCQVYCVLFVFASLLDVVCCYHQCFYSSSLILALARV
jgi:hypothetical protein